VRDPGEEVFGGAHGRHIVIILGLLIEDDAGIDDRLVIGIIPFGRLSLAGIKRVIPNHRAIVVVSCHPVGDEAPDGVAALHTHVAHSACGAGE